MHAHALHLLHLVPAVEHLRRRIKRVEGSRVDARARLARLGLPMPVGLRVTAQRERRGAQVLEIGVRDRAEPEDPLSLSILTPFHQQRAHLKPQLGLFGCGH